MSDSFDGMNPVLARQIQALIAASGGRLYLESGYRSVEEQTRLYNNAVAKYGPDGAGKWVAPPGKSNHNKGAAADIGGDLDVLAQLAPQFGLVLPMSWEPWHVEMASTREHSDPEAYVGVPPTDMNPTEADWSQNPTFVAASFAEGLMGMDSGLLGTAGGPLSQIIGTLESTPGVQGMTQGAATTGGATTTGNVTPEQVYAALIAQGLPPSVAAAGVAIAGRESGYNTGAHNDNASTGDDSLGLFQINLLGGGWTSFLQQHGLANPRTDLTTLEGAAKGFAALYNSSGLHPWGGYKGMPWSYSTDLNAGVAASGGAVTLADLQGVS